MHRSSSMSWAAKTLEGTSLAVLVMACETGTAVATTTTTAGSQSAALASGQSCMRDGACESGFCDHPVGFCDVPGVCRDVLPCPRLELNHGIEQMDSRECVRSWHDRGVPGLCIAGLESAP